MLCLFTSALPCCVYSRTSCTLQQSPYGLIMVDTWVYQLPSPRAVNMAAFGRSTWYCRKEDPTQFGIVVVQSFPGMFCVTASPVCRTLELGYVCSEILMFIVRFVIQILLIMALSAGLASKFPKPGPWLDMLKKHCTFVILVCGIPTHCW